MLRYAGTGAVERPLAVGLVHRGTIIRSMPRSPLSIAFDGLALGPEEPEVLFGTFHLPDQVLPEQVGAPRG